MIDYLSSNSFEADVRLADAMLYAALRQALGDGIAIHDGAFYRVGTNPVWGEDRLRSLDCRREEARGPYRDGAVWNHLGGAQLATAGNVQPFMDSAAASGHGVILRNMADPIERIRYCSPGDRFSSHASAISADQDNGHGILVQPDFGLSHLRRYLVAGGEIAGETPYRFCDDEPLLLLDPENRHRQTRDFMSDFEPLDPVWSALQREAAEALLAEYPLISGAIDVGILQHQDGGTEAQVESITAARPGAFAILFADPVAYAQKVTKHLLRIEPGLAPDAQFEP